MDLGARIIQAVEQPLREKGYDLVNVRVRNVSSGKRGSVLVAEVDIERLDNRPTSIEDCAAASRLISVIMDVEDFIKSKYNLEVSSPGEFRLLRKIEDYERFQGRSIRLEWVESEGVVAKEEVTIVGVVHESDCDYIDICRESGNIRVSLDCVRKATIKRDYVVKD